MKARGENNPGLAVWQSIISVILDCATVALVYFAAIAWGARRPWAIALFSGGSLLVLACRLIGDGWRGHVRLYRSGLYLPAFALLALAGLQRLAPRAALDAPSSLLPHTVEPHTTSIYLLLGAGYAALGLSVIHGFRSKRRLLRLVLFLFTLGVLESFCGLLQYPVGFKSPWEPPVHGDTAHGTLANPNHFALLLNLFLALGTGYLYQRSIELLPGRELGILRILSMPESPKLVWIGAWLALIGLAVTMSLSRTGIFAMLVSIGVMWAAVRIRAGGKRASALVFLVLFAILGLGLYGGAEKVLARYARIAQPGYLEHDRVGIWRDAWKLVGTNPWLGRGLGSFQWTFPAYESLEPDRPAVFAHNDYLQVLAEMGIVGLALALWALVAGWRSALRNLRAADPLVRGVGLATLGALAAAAVQEITDYSLYTPGVAASLICLLALNERAAWFARENPSPHHS